MRRQARQQAAAAARAAAPLLHRNTPIKVPPRSSFDLFVEASLVV